MGPRGAWAQYVILEPYTHIWDMSEISPEATTFAEINVVGLRQVNRALTLAAVSSFTREFELGDAVVLIYGAGPIGNAVLLNVKRHLPLSTVIMVDLKDHRLEVAKENGADYTINFAKTTPTERENMIKDITLRKPRPDLGSAWGVDLLFDCTGRNANDVIPEGIKMCRPGAIFIETGAYVYKTTGTFTIDPHEFCSRELIICSGWAYPFSTIDLAVRMLKKDKDLQRKYAKMITHKHALEEGMSAIESCIRAEGVKHVFDPWK